VDADREARTDEVPAIEAAPRDTAPGALGQSLARAARRLATRRMPALRWLAALEPLIDRITALPVPSGERFRRTPAPVGPGPVGPPEAADVPSWDEPDGEPVPAGLRARLREIVGPGSEAVRLHAGDRAAAVAEGAGADALTVGRHVFLGRASRRGDDEALALLSHETEHVLRGLRPGAAWRRATQAGADEEERAALGRERAARNYLRGDTLPGAAAVRSRDAAAPGIPPASVRSQEAIARAVQPAGATSAAMRPMAAAGDRDRWDTAAVPPPAPDIEAIKRAVHRDLLSRIKSDIERGG
jgi:hypothetical protein